MNRFRLFFVAVICLLTLSAAAQSKWQEAAHWQWLDKDGRKVFSDRAPPPEIPEKDILERPSLALAPARPTSGASAPRPSGVDKELADKKKKVEEAEFDKRRTEEEKIQKMKAENCARAKRAKASFDSGRQIARPNDKGEPEVLNATTRAAELARIQSVIDSDCQ
ncbi:MAG: DUF4124 domain-containing protein [Rhodoferax sp.]|uniref:DUF4124 domain-containing protein n=1 Tax=Rhodoferax sp. TaxID=50421 RepID=UPI00261FA8EA|nr:DUF4124 domain-containing protein [Rhodoferax sp.]MDD5336470.1 DUF4124 domain-containing protein [Rhodoferax sp.]